MATATNQHVSEHSDLQGEELRSGISHVILRNGSWPQSASQHARRRGPILEKHLLQVGVHLRHDLRLREVRDAHVLRPADEVGEDCVARRSAALHQKTTDVRRITFHNSAAQYTATFRSERRANITGKSDEDHIEPSVRIFMLRGIKWPNPLIGTYEHARTKRSRIVPQNDEQCKIDYLESTVRVAQDHRSHRRTHYFRQFSRFR
jgi:hypothetical protein